MRRAILLSLLLATAAGADTPGKVRKIIRQDGGGGGGSFSGDLEGNTLTDSTNSYVKLDVPLQPPTSSTLVINDEGGTAALTVETTGNTTFGANISLPTNGIILAGGANKIRLEASEIELTNSIDLHLQDNGDLFLGSGSDAGLKWSTAQTLDSLLWTFNSAGGERALILADFGNTNNDLGLSTIAAPRLVLTSTTDWTSDATEFWQIYVGVGGSAVYDTGATGHNHIFRINNSTKATVTGPEFALSSDVDLALADNGYIIWGGSNDLGLERNAEGVLRIDNASGTTADGNLYLVSADEADGVFLSANGVAGELRVGATAGASDGVVFATALETTSGTVAVKPAGVGAFTFASSQFTMNTASMVLEGSGSIGFDPDESGTAIVRKFAGHITGISDNTETTFFSFDLPTDLDYAGGTAYITLQAKNAPGAMEIAHDEVQFVAQNDSGTVTASVSFDGSSNQDALGSWTARSYQTSVSTNTVSIRGTWNSSLSVNAMEAIIHVVLNSPDAESASIP